MNKNSEEQYRGVFEDQVKEKILGPGYARDIIACDDDASNEILDEDPIMLYCTGVMTPQGIKSSDVDEDNAEDGESNNGHDQIDGQDDDSDEDGNYSSDIRNQDHDDRSFFESDHIGLITCLSPETKCVKIEVTYAKYKLVDDISTVHFKACHLYESLENLIKQNDTEEVNNYLKDKKQRIPFSSLFIFNPEDRTVSLSKKIDKSIYKVMENSNDPAMGLLKKMIRGKFFKREPKTVTKEISLANVYGNNDEQKKNAFELSEDLECFIKSYPSKDVSKLYIKVLIRNKNKKSENNSEGLYKKCLFQTVLKLTPIGGKLLTYTEPIISLDDVENDINEYIYRDVVNYGKGVGCAAEWASDGSWIGTTYMPRCEVRKFSNEIGKDYLQQISSKINCDDIKDVCTLRNLSKWSTWSDKEIIAKLSSFVDGYDIWHQSEIEKTNGIDSKYNKASQDILHNQNELLARLRENIEFMRNTPEALECFKIANTAMLIQMVVARDSNFVKNRDKVENKKELFDSIDYFQSANYMSTMKQEPSYRPFQLAFLLMNVKSTLVEDDPYRTKYVDLIWFPTGGGKTEAYLALTALTIIARKRNSADVISGNNEKREPNYTKGVSVIMRYTLRLLTSQQFERASFLICALDFLRDCDKSLGLGDHRISIGLWVGKATTPNKKKELEEKNGKYSNFIEDSNAINNPFPVAYCPWCGQKLKISPKNHGYRKDGILECVNDSCHFNTDTQLPIYYIDDVVYSEKPTLLFATVDKFAQLFIDDAAKLLRAKDYKSPDLIIQDELHLISGPLGSTVSLFESIVEELASKDGHKPKIIASTATTRNTGALIKSLYGKSREVNIFPAQGTSYTDNYFSHLEDNALRCHIGIMPTSRTTSNDTETRLTATLILCRAKLAIQLMKNDGVDILDNNAVIDYLRDTNHYLKKELDIFWSIVLYYNSLKDLGRAKSRASQEVYENLQAKLPYFQIPQSLSFIYNGFDRRKKEFTSREDSSRIKKLLTDAESCAKLEDWEKGVVIGGETMDMIYASNMISVGIDIDRWNIMIMVGQPRSTSEYIQSSSRVARSHKGLVYNLINPQRIREFSLFENYTSFHTAYYKYVEPLSATPLNSQMLKLPLWVNIVDCYKDFIVAAPQNSDLKIMVANGVVELLKKRYDFDEVMELQIKERIKGILDNCDENHMESLRDVDADCFMMIKNIDYPRK